MIPNEQNSGQRRRSRRSEILVALADDPATAEEIGRRFGRQLRLVRSRIAQLKAEGYIMATGKRRKTVYGRLANRWRLSTEPERSALIAARIARQRLIKRDEVTGPATRGL